MDAAGKDSTIRSVISGVNPHGVMVTPFKHPSDRELDSYRIQIEKEAF